MCLTIPAQIKKIKGLEAELADGRKINIALISKPKKGSPAETSVKAGDWVLVNANLGLSKISVKEAKEIKGYFEL